MANEKHRTLIRDTGTAIAAHLAHERTRAPLVEMRNAMTEAATARTWLLRLAVNTAGAKGHVSQPIVAADTVAVISDPEHGDWWRGQLVAVVVEELARLGWQAEPDDLTAVLASMSAYDRSTARRRRAA